MAMMPLRWRVDCRKDRRGWRTTHYEPHDLLCEAVTARLFHLLTEDWDSVEVMPIVGTRGEGRRLLTAGARVRCP
jgi:hypothetical protein